MNQGGFLAVAGKAGRDPRLPDGGFVLGSKSCNNDVPSLREIPQLSPEFPGQQIVPPRQALACRVARRWTRRLTLRRAALTNSLNPIAVAE